jgi:lipopolysaccharide export system permease protein
MTPVPVLARYLGREILVDTLLVLLVLLALTGLYLFIGQQDDIGVGTYTTQDGFVFVLLSLPKYAFDMLPIAALIGSLLALGNLARSMELTVIRAAGVSTWRMARWIFLAGLILMLITAALGEYAAPEMQRYAIQMKTFKKYRNYSMAGNRSAWAKDGERIIAVRPQSPDNSRYGGVYIFHFDAQHHLRSVGSATNARANVKNQWELEDYRQTSIGEDRVEPSRQRLAELATKLSPEFLGLAVLDADTLPGRSLYAYARHLKENGLDAREYETALWSRVARTATVAIIVVLALPFAFGPMRATGTGARTVVGIMIGVVFFLATRMFESSGAVFNLPPLAVAWTPAVLLSIVTAIAVSRVR